MLLKCQQTDSSYHFRLNSHCMKSGNTFGSRALKTFLFSDGTLTRVPYVFTPHKPEAQLLLPQNSVHKFMCLPQRIPLSVSVRGISIALSMQSNLEPTGSLCFQWGEICGFKFVYTE